MACLERYKNLRRLIVDEKYNVPPPIDIANYNLENDPDDVEKSRL